MTVLETPKIVLGTFTGLSTDIKPTTTGGGLPVNIGTRFEETDTGKIFRFNGLLWVEESPTAEGAAFAALQPRSSFISLLGDTFALQPAQVIYLLEDTTGLGADLGKVGTIPFEVEEDLPLRGFKVATYDGTGSNRFETPQVAGNQVGTNSFVTSIQFKTSVSLVTGTFYKNGDLNGLYKLDITNSQVRGVLQGNNATIALITHAFDSTFTDNKWHTLTWFIDRTRNIMSLFLDGTPLVDITSGNTEVDISGVTGSIDFLGSSNFTIGGDDTLTSTFD